MYDLAFIIVSYNSEKYIAQCLKSIFKLDTDYTYKIVVVDNNSNDRSVSISSMFNDVEIIANKSNLGFGVANNIGVKSVNAKLYYLLNVDAYFDSFDLDRLIKKIISIRKFAIAGTTLQYPDGSSQTSHYSYSKPMKWLIQLLPGYYFLSHKVRGNRVLSKILSPLNSSFKSYFNNHSDIKKSYSINNVDWVCGASMIISKEYIESFGLFDENIFLYGEDEDLCIMAHKNGYEVCYISTDPVIHIHGWNSTGKTNKIVLNYKYNSLRYFIDKHFSGYKRHVMHFILPIYVYGYRGVVSGKNT